MCLAIKKENDEAYKCVYALMHQTACVQLVVDVLAYLHAPQTNPCSMTASATREKAALLTPICISVGCPSLTASA